MMTQEHSEDLERWFTTPLGAYVFEREQTYFDATVADVFGFNALQLGETGFDFLRASRMPLKCAVGPHASACIRADLHDLPIATGSIDLVVLPHVLEFSADPHQLLREVDRVLMPEGQLIVSTFNPWSLWGARRVLAGPPAEFPWNGRFINLPRLKDWLSLLSFEITAGRMSCYVPPFVQDKWIRRFDFMEAAGDRWWPFAGGVYFLHAVKRVRGMRLIMPKWSDRLASRRRLAPIPQRIAGQRSGMTTRRSGDRSMRARFTLLPGGRK